MRRLAAGLLILFALVVAAGLALRLTMLRPAESRLRPGEDVAIAKLPARLPPDAFVACPPGSCAVADAAPSPEFATGVERLRVAFEQMLAAEPRVVTAVAEPRRLVVIQRSALFAFPDIVIAEFVALGPDRSSLALYSRARYGRSDFGVNRRRVERWLARLRAIVTAQ